MAAKKETYDLIFRGVDKVTPEMRAIVASFEKLNTTVKKTGKDLDEAGKISALSDKFGNVSDAVDGSIGAFGRLGTTVAKTTLALSALAVGGLVYAASKAMELETSIVNLDKVLGDQERDQLPSLIKRTQEFADAYGFAGTEAIDSAANFRKAGFALEDAAHLSELAAKLVIGAGEAAFDTAESTNSLIAILRGFKVAQEDIIPTSTKLADILNKLADETSTSVSELSEGLKILSPIAGQLGFSLEETAGLMIPVIEVFRSGSESARGLKTAFLRLSDPTDKMLGIFDQLGIKVNNADGSLKNVKTILGELAPAFLKLDDAQKVQATSILAGKDQAAKFAALLNNMARAAEATDIAYKKSAGSLEKELVRGLATAEVQVKRVEAAFVNLSAAVGNQFLAASKDGIKGFAELEIVIRKLVESGKFEPLFKVVRDITTEFGSVFESIAKNLPGVIDNIDFQGLANSISDITRSLKGIFGIDDLKTAEGLQSAIQGVVDTFKSLISFTGGFINAFKPFIAIIKTAVDVFNSLPDGIKEAVGVLAGLSVQLASLVAGAAGAVLSFKAFALAFPAAASAISSLTLAASAAAAGLVTAAAVIGVAIGTLLRQIPGLDELTQKIIGITIDGKKADFKIGESEDALRSKAEAVYKYQSNIRAAASATKELVNEQKSSTERTKEQIAAWDKWVDEINKTSDLAKKGLKFAADVDISKVNEKTVLLKDEFGNLRPKVTVETEVDKKSVDKTKKTLTEIEKTKIEVEGKVEVANIEKTKEEIKSLNSLAEKEIEFKTKLDITSIEAEAKKFTTITEQAGETARKALEVKAEVDIAQAVADTEKFTSIMESTTSIVTELSGAIGTMFGQFSKDLDFYQMKLLEESIRQQIRIQDEAAEGQKELIKLELEKRRLQNEILANPDKKFGFKVDFGADVEPALEYLLIYMLKKTRIIGTNYGVNQLLEVPI